MNLHTKRQDLLDRWTQQHNPLRGLDMRRLVRVFEDAEKGHYADLQWLNRTVGRRDALVRAVNRRLKSALMELEWKVSIPDEEDLPAGYSKDQAEAQQEFLTNAYNQVENLWDAICFLAQADFKGFSHVEIHRDAALMPVRLQRVEQWHWFREGWYGEWLYNPKAVQYPKELYQLESPENWIIREVEDPAYEIFATAFLRKNLAYKDWDGFIENFGIPWIFLVMPPGLSPEQQQEWQATAESIVSDGRGVLPAGGDVKEASAANRGVSPFVDYLRRHDEDIVLTATGGLLTILNDGTGLGSGQSASHQDAWHEIVGGIAREVTEIFQSKLDKPLLERQFAGQPVMAWFDLSRPEQQEAADKVADLVVKLHQAGHRVSREWIQERTGVEIEDDSVPPAGAPLLNRSGANAPARIARAALADALEIADDYLAPLQPRWDALMKLAKDKQATRADFEKAAAALEAELPDVLKALEIDVLAESLEKAFRDAAAQGAADAMNRRAKSNG